MIIVTSRSLPIEAIELSTTKHVVISLFRSIVQYRGKGRPKKEIDRLALEQLLNLNVPIKDIAEQLGVSRPVVYKAIKDFGINYERFSRLSESDVEHEVRVIKQDHPNSGEVMVQGHLQSKGIHVQRDKVRKAIHAVDPEGVEQRKQKPIKRRVYQSPFPNYVWHIDGNHKMIRWRLVVHHGIDGFSRMVVFARCSSNNRATTVPEIFLQAIEKYGRPLKVRTDLGGENVDIWRDMVCARGEECKPVLVGKSVHNQRIERHNRALNEQVTSVFRSEFYQLEAEGVLDINNDLDIFCLHVVYLPKINKILKEFVAAHNNHRISTENNRTAEQLFWCNILAAEHFQGVLPEHPNQPALNELEAMDLPYVQVPDPLVMIDTDVLNRLTNIVQNMSSNGSEATSIYKEVVRCVGEHLLGEPLVITSHN